MNEVKNKEFILISCGACLVIIMLILYFSGLNVAKGSYGAVVLSEYTCSKTDYQVVKDSKGNAKCCPSDYKMENDFCIPKECKEKKCSVECQSVKTPCVKSLKDGKTSYHIVFEAKWKGKTCTKSISGFSQDVCDKKPTCECTLTDDLRMVADDAIKKSSSSSSSCMTQGECQSRYGANNCVRDSSSCWSKSSSSSSTGNNITIRFYNGYALVKEESCVKGSCNSIIAPGTQPIPKERSAYKFYNDSTKYEFTGWGSSSCLTTVGYGASYPANHSFDNKSLTASAVYYACYREKKTVEEPDKFDVNKCNFSQEFTVTYDVNYKNCKYINIGYNNSQSERTEANVKACCIAKGWTWVGSNFNSSGNDYEYCVKCGGSSPSPSSPSSPSIPSSTPSSTPSSSSNIDKNPQTGSIAIFMVWVIALGALVYSFFYFKQSRFE